MVKTSYCDKTGLKRGAWSPEEDRKLSAYIKKYDHWNWREIPRFAGLSRCGKSCRLRWKNYLRPNIRRGNYTQEEEEIIINLHETLGNRWSAIAAKLPGRTDNEVKNHWHTHLKKRMQRSSTPREEAILQPVTEVSECESESADLVDTFLDNALRPFILESSSVVSVSLESAILEKSASPADTNSETKQKVGNIIQDTTNEISGNLWAEFFQMPDSNFVGENFTSSLVDPELVFPPPSLHDWTDPNQVIDDAKPSFEEDFIAASMLDQDTVIPTSPLYSLSDEPIQEADSNFFDDNFIHYMGDQDFIFLSAPFRSWVESFQVAESNFSAENFTSNQLANPENVFESSSTNSFDNGEEVYFNHLLLGGEEVPILF